MTMSQTLEDAILEKRASSVISATNTSCVDNFSDREAQSVSNNHACSLSSESISTNTSMQKHRKVNEYPQGNHVHNRASSTDLLGQDYQPEASVYYVQPVSTHTHTAIILLNGSAEDVDTFVSLYLPFVAIQFPNWRWVFPLAVSGLEHPDGNWFIRS